MALGDSYASTIQLEQRVGDADDGSFEQLLDAASRAVESFTRRQFNRTDTATARRFRALDRERVAVDDFHTVTDLAVDVDGTAWDPANYDPRPWDGVRHGQLAWPFSDLFAVGRCWPWSRRALIAVTAQWGWDAVPAAIVEATLDAAEAMYSTRRVMQPSAATVRSETMGGYSISFAVPSAGPDVPPEMVRAVPYRRKIFGVA